MEGKIRAESGDIFASKKSEYQHVRLPGIQNHDPGKNKITMKSLFSPKRYGRYLLTAPTEKDRLCVVP